MRVLNERVDLARLLQSVRSARQRALFLDFDGTLAAFSTDRSSVRPYNGVTSTLQDLVRAPRHRLVFVTGRPALELRDLVDIDPRPEIWGSHGMERVDRGGHVRASPLSREARTILDGQARIAAALLGRDRVERKPFGIAVHVRGLDPEAAATAVAQAEQRFERFAGRYQLRVCRFDGGIELCVGSRTKADAVATILDELDGPYAAAYLGDDLTDEEAFVAIRPHGAGILVRDELRETAADLWLRPPGELVAFLARWRDAATGAAA